jgi:hypothetical protein
VAADGTGNACISGSFSGTADFDPGAGTYSLFSGGSSRSPNQAAYVEKLNTNGGFAWAVAFQATGTSRSSPSHSAVGPIAVDSAGNVYSTGTWAGTVDFDPASKASSYLPAGSGGMYVSKLSASGQLVWAKGLGGSAPSISPNGIAIDPSGNVDLTGTFAGTANFNPGGTYTLTSTRTASGSYASDAFALQLDGAGAFQWAAGAGGAGGVIVCGIAVDGYGNVSIAGTFAGMANFDPNGTQTRSAQAPGQDGFLWKLKRTP